MNTEDQINSVEANEIVVGVDGGAAAAAALAWAAAQARVTGASLRVVHSWQVTAYQVEGTGPAFIAARAADARASATAWVRDALGSGADEVHWVLDIVEGAPGPVLTERSRRARVVVLGTGDHVGLRRMVSGSVSHYVLSHALGPVVAVPAARVMVSA